MVSKPLSNDSAAKLNRLGSYLKEIQRGTLSVYNQEQAEDLLTLLNATIAAIREDFPAKEDLT